MNQVRGKFLLAIALLAVVFFLALALLRKPSKTSSSPISASVPAPVLIETNQATAPQNPAKGYAQFTTGEIVDFTNKFETKFKPAIERWCKIYAGRLPFREDDVSIDKFHSRIGGYLYTFMIGSTTFTIADTEHGARVFYMMTRDGAQMLNGLPKAGAAPVISMPVSRPIILRLLKADAGIDYPADQVQLHPTGQFSALPGGVMVEAGGITGNNVYRAMTNTNLDFVLDGNGNLVSYQH